MRFGAITPILGAVTNAAKISTDDMLSVQQLADHLGVSVRTALRRVQSGEIPATKLPGRTGAWVVSRRVLSGLRPQDEHDEFAA